jgi:hypothetical protein
MTLPLGNSIALPTRTTRLSLLALPLRPPAQ